MARAISKRQRKTTLYPTQRPFRLAGSLTPQRIGQSYVAADGVSHRVPAVKASGARRLSQATSFSRQTWMCLWSANGSHSIECSMDWIRL